jgi:hypothetical protein
MACGIFPDVPDKKPENAQKPPAVETRVSQADEVRVLEI